MNSAVSLVVVKDFKHFRTSRLTLHSALLVAYHPRMWRANVISSICLYVCLSVCLFLKALTLDRL